MIGDAADLLWKGAQSTQGSAQILVKPWPPCRVDGGCAILRAENEVIMKAEIGRGHGKTLAPLPGCWFIFLLTFRWCRPAAETTG